MAEESGVSTVRTHVAAQEKRGLQWMRSRAQNVLCMIHRLFCQPSACGLVEDYVCIRAQPPTPSVVTIISISNSTLNNCSFTNQDGPQAAPDLLQMLPELLINGRSRSVHITRSELHYSMIGDHNVMRGLQNQVRTS